MNQRILELFEQAGFPKFDIKNEAEKFAELIIEECIQIVKPSEYHRAYPDNMLGGLDGLDLLDKKIKDIKTHFSNKKDE